MEHDVLQLQESIGLATVPCPNHLRLAPQVRHRRTWPGIPRGSRCASISRSGWHLDVVSTQCESCLDSPRLRKTISRVLPDCGVPALYTAEQPFDGGEKGQTGLAEIEAIIKAQNPFSIANLSTDRGMITSDSDFVLLSGPSPFLGRPGYLLWKQRMGANRAAVELFTNSAVKGIAALVLPEIQGAGHRSLGIRSRGRRRERERSGSALTMDGNGMTMTTSCWIRTLTLARVSATGPWTRRVSCHTRSRCVSPSSFLHILH